MSIVLCAIFLFCIPYTEVKAAEEIQTVDENVVELEAFSIDVTQNSDIGLYATTFNEAIISISFDSEGMYVEFFTSMSKEASIVGVKDIKIQKKVWYGWTTVATSDGATSYDCLSSACGVRYRGAELGETYRVLCTHFADVDGYRDYPNETSGYVYTY